MQTRQEIPGRDKFHVWFATKLNTLARVVPIMNLSRGGLSVLQVFEELTPEAVDIIKPDILPVIRGYVANQINETIHHLTMRDLIRTLLGEYEFGDITHLLIP